MTSALDDGLEAAVRHASDSERHVRRHPALRHLGHHALVDRVPVRFRLEDDEREEYGLARLGARELRERAAAGHALEIVALALVVAERAVLHPDALAPLRHALVSLHLGL